MKYSVKRSCFFEKDTDYCGHDVESSSLSADSGRHCQELCQIHEKCQFWSYSEGGNHCYLKSSDIGRYSYPGITSGTKFCSKYQNLLR